MQLTAVLVVKAVAVLSPRQLLSRLPASLAQMTSHWMELSAGRLLMRYVHTPTVMRAQLALLKHVRGVARISKGGGFLDVSVSVRLHVCMHTAQIFRS